MCKTLYYPYALHAVAVREANTRQAPGNYERVLLRVQDPQHQRPNARPLAYPYRYKLPELLLFTNHSGVDSRDRSLRVTLHPTGVVGEPQMAHNIPR